MRSYLLILLLFSLVPAALLKPHFGLLIYSWFGYMNPHRLTYGLAQQIPFAMLFAAVTIIGWLLSKEDKKIPINVISVLLITYAVWISITTVFAIVPDAAFEKWSKVMKILLMTALTLTLISSRERIIQLVWAMVIALGFWGAQGGFFTIITGGQYRVYGPERSFIGENNALGLALIMTLPLMRYLQISTKRLWLKLVFAGWMVLTVFSILGSHSRGAFLAGAAMVFMLWLRSRHRISLAIALVALISSAIVFMPPKYLERMETLKTYDEDKSANSRLTTWEFTYRFALTSPLVGGGFAMFQDFATRNELMPGSKLMNAHSIWFETLGEHGFVGLVIFVAFGAAAIRTCGKARSLTRKNPSLVWAHDLASMLQVSLVGFAVGGTFLNQASFDFFWQIAALSMCLLIVIRRELEQHETSSSQHHASITPAAEALDAAVSDAGNLQATRALDKERV